MLLKILSYCSQLYSAENSRPPAPHKCNWATVVTITTSLYLGWSKHLQGLSRGLRRKNRPRFGVFPAQGHAAAPRLRPAFATIPPPSKQLTRAKDCAQGGAARAEAWGMNRDETVALFLECEAKRGEARAALTAELPSPAACRSSCPPRSSSCSASRCAIC